MTEGRNATTQTGDRGSLFATRIERFSGAWTFARVALGYGRRKSLRVALHNARHLPTPPDDPNEQEPPRRLRRA